MPLQISTFQYYKIFARICKIACEYMQKKNLKAKKLSLGHCLHNGHLMHICGHPYAKLLFITCIGEGLLDILYVEI
jgi:hypothetical protein